MAEHTWPTFPGADGSPEVTPVCKTERFEAEAGTAWALELAPARTRYTFTYNGLSTVDAAPAPWGAMTELAAARYIFAAILRGRAGRINVIDPHTGASVECECEDDEFPLEQDEGAPWYRGTISFISV